MFGANCDRLIPSRSRVARWPLSNPRDLTLRALDVLREATLIVAEDSRVARRLP
jgi:16S rRNA C1402 (ribose-2'-O) methylase RsmI